MRRPLAPFPRRPNPTDPGDAADLSTPEGIEEIAKIPAVVRPAGSAAKGYRNGRGNQSPTGRATAPNAVNHNNSAYRDFFEHDLFRTPESKVGPGRGCL